MIWIFSHRRDETAIKAVNKKPIYRVVLYQTIVSVYNIAECILYTVLSEWGTIKTIKYILLS